MNETIESTQDKSVPAIIMSVFSIVPFIGCALTLILLGKESPVFGPVVEMFKTWSAIMLAFMGGVRWGSTVFSAPDSPSKMSAATLLPVAGWLALFISGPFGILALLLIYCAQGAWDSFSPNLSHMPQWYARVRIMFVLLIVACHMVVFVAIY
ncbi:MAG: hypothetical protein COB78_04630 [Hyphomicrobiales bacterium]|nr:MAG: hypothetical protein COB78_04630 [Hyphomicrobiales bacterium]